MGQAQQYIGGLVAGTAELQQTLQRDNEGERWRDSRRERSRRRRHHGSRRRRHHGRRGRRDRSSSRVHHRRGSDRSYSRAGRRDGSRSESPLVRGASLSPNEYRSRHGAYSPSEAVNFQQLLLEQEAQQEFAPSEQVNLQQLLLQQEAEQELEMQQSRGHGESAASSSDARQVAVTSAVDELDDAGHAAAESVGSGSAVDLSQQEEQEQLQQPQTEEAQSSLGQSVEKEKQPRKLRLGGLADMQRRLARLRASAQATASDAGKSPQGTSGGDAASDAASPPRHDGPPCPESPDDVRPAPPQSKLSLAKPMTAKRRPIRANSRLLTKKAGEERIAARTLLPQTQASPSPDRHQNRPVSPITEVKRLRAAQIPLPKHMFI